MEKNEHTFDVGDFVTFGVNGALHTGRIVRFGVGARAGAPERHAVVEGPKAEGAILYSLAVDNLSPWRPSPGDIVSDRFGSRVGVVAFVFIDHPLCDVRWDGQERTERRGLRTLLPEGIVLSPIEGVLMPIPGKPGHFESAEDAAVRVRRAEELARIDALGAAVARARDGATVAPSPSGRCLRCGGPAYVGLLEVECLAEKASGVCEPPKPPEPARVIEVWREWRGPDAPPDCTHWAGVTIKGRRGAERHFEASGENICVQHPTREGAIEAWRHERAMTRIKILSHAGVR